MNRLLPLAAALPALLLAATAAAASPDGTHAGHATPATATHAPGADRSPVARTQPFVLVHKSPTCSCCAKWIEHLRAAGFHVDVDATDDLAAIKQRVGVPPAKGSCHTAEVGGYFIEGHVPAEDVKRLLAEKPDARGLTAPGMPMGSPGMEMEGMDGQAYTVLLVKKDGSTVEYARHGGAAAH